MTDSQANPEGTIEEKSSKFEVFLKNFEGQTCGEEKLKCSIDFMKEALSQEKEPNFKGFWEARKLCLSVFKENLNPVARSKLWGDFVELSSEARRLKSILDEQANFAIEQLELAIKSLENDIEKYGESLASFSEIEFPEQGKFLKHKQSDYSSLQKELNLLNTFAAKINALRKELIKTDMRVRFKSKFFKSLSVSGDKIFPKRNEIIKKVSTKFSDDVIEFVKTHFSSEMPSLPAYVLREEIKSLQNVAKILTLNTKAFTETRLKLSECWDKLKALDEEKKKEFLEKKKATRENFENVEQLIRKFLEECQSGLSLSLAESKSSEILEHMKTVELQSLEVKKLKKDLKDALNIIIEKDKAEKSLKEKKAQEELEIKRQKIEQIKSKIIQLVEDEEKYDSDGLTKEKELIANEIEALPLSKIEKQLLERSLKPLKDAINDKKEKAILDLSDDQIETLGKLKEALAERLQRRSEIKQQIENYRKTIGGSGLDFEKAMLHGELMEQEKKSLDKINFAIEEIEEKIAKFER